MITTEHEIPKGVLAFLKGWQDKAMQLETLVPAVPLRRDQWLNQYERAHALFVAGRYEQALPMLVELLRNTPAVAQSHFSVGACLHRLRRYREAVQSYLTAYALDVDDALGLFHAADCLLALGLGNEARMTLERFIQATPVHTRQALVARAEAMLEGLPQAGGAASAETTYSAESDKTVQ